MKVTRLLLASCLACALAGCTRNSTLPVAVAVGDAFGNAGRGSGTTADGQHWEISVTHHQHDNWLTYYVLGQLPGEDPAPGALLLIRTTAPNRWESLGVVATTPGKTQWQVHRSAAGGKMFDLGYEISHKPVGELFKLGGQTYDLNSGRVFLIDLTQEPVKPVQVKADVVTLLPSRDPAEAELKAAVEKLKENKEAVRTFLDNPR
jgi:hypothetical protein